MLTISNKFTLFNLLFIFTFNSRLLPQDINIKAINPVNDERNNVILEVCLDSIPAIEVKQKTGNIAVLAGDKLLPSEIIKKNEGRYLLIKTDFQPKEVKQLKLQLNNTSTPPSKLTSVYIGEKVNYVKKDKIFTEGKFVSTKRTKIPGDHTPQDAYYQYEGAGWESDKVAYRIYLDERNKIDIFGKVVPDPVLSQIGKNDLLPGNESYTKMMNWGMDIFKVAATLGMGSFALYNDKIIPVMPDSTVCTLINNGLLYSDLNLSYYGTELNGKKLDVYSNISIKAGGRLTKNQISLQGASVDLCAGLAKHADTEFIKSGGAKGWQYIGIYGKQSLAGDNLGIALFYNSGNTVEQKEDELNQLVVFRPDKKNSITYYFCAAWEHEPGGVKNISEFRDYLAHTVKELNNPIVINYN